jgi:hypothetical protein
MAKREFDAEIERKWLQLAPEFAANARKMLDWYDANIRVPWDRVPLHTAEEYRVLQMMFLMRSMNGKVDRLKILLRCAAASPEFCRVRHSLARAIGSWAKIRRCQSALLDLYSKPMIADSLVESVASAVEADKKRKQRANWDCWSELQRKMRKR